MESYFKIKEMAEKSAENIGYELLRCVEDNFDDISSSHASCGDLIWVEETSDLRQKKRQNQSLYLPW